MVCRKSPFFFNKTDNQKSTDIRSKKKKIIIIIPAFIYTQRLVYIERSLDVP